MLCLVKVAATREVYTESVMGTVVSIDVRDAVPAPAVIAAAIKVLHDVDRRFSTYRPSSAVSRVARGDLPIDRAPTDVRQIYARCLELQRDTDGYFDAWATGSFDPSALVKGWAIQRAADVLSAAGLRNFCVACGGDLVCRGGALPDSHWRVGIQHPLDREAVAGVARVRDVAVATSGAYERGEHVRDPHTGEAPTGLLSVTVIGPDLGTADALSTAAFAMGVAGTAWTARLKGYETLTILADHTVLATPKFPSEEDR